MSKRQHSPEPRPSTKRLHTEAGPALTNLKVGFDAHLYDELILVIFSYLSWSDLCAVQATNRNWSRLALDNQLWKWLYLKEYGRPRLRGVRGFIGRGDGREVRPLPGRAKTDDVRDWKWMFRISSNWRTGRCSVEQFASSVGAVQHIPRDNAPETQTSRPHTHILLAGSVIISACSNATALPVVTLTSPRHTPYTLACPARRLLDRGVELTSLALDQSQPSIHEGHRVRLVAFSSSGEFHLFSVNHVTPSTSHLLGTYTPSSAVNSARVTPIIHSVYHHPLLVTLSQSFHLSLYDLTDVGRIVHSQTLTSYTSYPPTSLVLSAPSPFTYKLVLAYAIPVYPAHWSVGATELIIQSDHGLSAGNSPIITVTNTRSTKAFDIPPGWVDDRKMLAVKEQWGRKVNKVSDTQTDGKWVILAPGDPAFSAPSSSQHTSHSLQLYRLHLPASLTSSAVPKMSFVRFLHGHIGPVSALSVADGRCVSLGGNGTIWVWDLESGTGAEVASGHRESLQVDGANDMEVDQGPVVSGKRGTVVFDERRIVSADVTGIEVRRFDI